jgi:hypothetical protein
MAARAAQEIVGHVVGAQRFEVNPRHPRQPRGHPRPGPKRRPVLGRTAGQHQTAAVRQCLGDQMQRQPAHLGGQFVEPVQHRQHPAPLQQHPGEGRVPVLPRRRRSQLGVVLHQLAFHPGPQIHGRRVPGGQGKEHGDRIARRPVLDQREQQPYQQQRLPRPRRTQHQQPPAGDAVREYRADLPVPARRPRRHLGQVGVGAPPGHRQRIRVRQPPRPRLRLPLPPYGDGEPVGDHRGVRRRGRRLGAVRPIRAPRQMGTGPRRQQRRDHGRRVLDTRGDQQCPQRARGEQGQVDDPGSPYARPGGNSAHPTKSSAGRPRRERVAATATRVGDGTVNRTRRPGHSSDDCGVFRGGERGSDPFTPPCKGAAGAPVARRKVGSSGEGTSEGGTG